MFLSGGTGIQYDSQNFVYKLNQYWKIIYVLLYKKWILKNIDLKFYIFNWKTSINHTFMNSSKLVGLSNVKYRILCSLSDFYKIYSKTKN